MLGPRLISAFGVPHLFACATLLVFPVSGAAEGAGTEHHGTAAIGEPMQPVARRAESSASSQHRSLCERQDVSGHFDACGL